jgi:hypothetical protein
MSDSYGHYRLPQLWTMVQGDNGDGAAYHLTTWERQITLLSEQSKRLKDLRADLVAKWPPDKSDASFAFISRVTEMINAMDQTVDDSVKVRTGLKQVADALENARKQLLPLVDQYDNKSAAWRSVTERAFPALPSNLLMGASVVPGADAMVVHMHQQKLDEQAREIMRSADQVVTEAQVPLSTRLPDYQRIDPGRIRVDVGPGRSRGSGRPAVNSPASVRQFIPPPVFDPPAPVTVGTGPVLAGTDPAVNGGALQPGVLGPGRPVPADLGRVVPGVIGGVGPIANVPDDVMRRIPPGRAVLRPGGVIDAHGPAFEPRATSHPAVPGVIGGIGGMAPVGRGRQGASPVERSSGLSPQPGRVIEGGGAPLATGMTGGWRDRQYEEYVKRRQEPVVGDPDDPWTVAEGIPPVVGPPPQRRHDVGPGVIGIDR